MEDSPSPTKNAAILSCDHHSALSLPAPRFHLLSHPQKPAIPLPSVILLTHYGQLPHLPTPLIPSTENPLLLHASLTDWYTLNEHHTHTGQSLFQTNHTIHDLTNHPNSTWFLGTRQPGNALSGINDHPGKKDGVIINGVRVHSRDVWKLGKLMNADFVQGLCEGPSLIDGGNLLKKIGRSVRKCEILGRELMEIVGEDERERIFLSVEGGMDIEERRRCAEIVKELVRGCHRDGGKKVAGIVISGLYAGESPRERWEAVKVVMEVFRKDGGDEAVILGGGNGAPEEVITAVGLGVDLVESSYPFDCAEAGWVLDLKQGKKMNVRNRQWVLDSGPLVDGCGCWVCAGAIAQDRFSRAYLRHLFEVHEMLGCTLLSAHNLSVYIEWVQELRDCVKEGKFNEFEVEFRKTRERRRQDPSHPREIWKAERENDV